MTSENLARKLRVHAVDMAHYSHESHVAAALSMCDIIAVLYNDILNISPTNIKDENRDRFVLSKGHACSVLYAALAEKGFFPIDDLNKQCQDGARLSGHITHKNVPGVEFSTGSLGHGCCVISGMALNGKFKNKDYKVYAVVGDGECDEGSVWEMALFAYQYKLGNLCIIVDHNKMQAMGHCAKIANHIDLAKKWRSFGWNVIEVDGHNHKELKLAFSMMKAEIPTCIIAHTVKGKGVSFMEDNLLWHYKDPQGEFYKDALKELGAL